MKRQTLAFMKPARISDTMSIPVLSIMIAKNRTQ